MFRVPEYYRIKELSSESDGNNGAFNIPYYYSSSKPPVELFVIASDGEGWEHVSVSIPSNRNKIPDWNMMCYIKDKFWGEEDIVMQLHPKKSEYVNNVNNVLHLWRPTDKEIPAPPAELVGLKGVKL